MRSPTGMLKVWEWLTASGLHDIKSVINGCHTVLPEWTAGETEEQVFHRINAQLWSSFQHWEIKSGCFTPSMNDHLLACGTQHLLMLITDLMISAETQDRSSLSPVREFRMWRGRGWVIATSSTGRSGVNEADLVPEPTSHSGGRRSCVGKELTMLLASSDTTLKPCIFDKCVVFTN